MGPPFWITSSQSATRIWMGCCCARTSRNSSSAVCSRCSKAMVHPMAGPSRLGADQAFTAHQAYPRPVPKAAEEVTKLPAADAPSTVISAAPVLKDPSGKSRAVGFANVAMVPSARDMTDLLKEYTFPENDAALGRGAFGTVMKVTHNGTGEVRAMKAVRLSDGADSAQLRELVELEISMLKSLDHVNLLRLHEAFRDSESCMYLITELCAGGSLAERLEQQRTLRKPMLEGMAAAYAEQILSAASYCHDRGVLHRDLKPENVLFLTPRSDSPVKVIDFGLSDTMERIRQNCTQEIHDRSGALGAVARLLPKLPGGLEILATKETKEVMQRAGTPHYMAPEVYTGMYGDRADVWSIGVILFEMLSNRHPFYTSGNDLEAVKRRILSPEGADFCDPSWGEVTAAAQRACRECLMSDPDRRPSAQRMLAHKWFDTVPRLALGMSGGMDSGRSGFLALARSPPRIAASQAWGNKGLAKASGQHKMGFCEPQGALHRLAESPWEKQETCYITLLKVLNNIVEHPAEAKFRHLKTSNAALRAKVFDLPGAKEFLLSCGFTEEEGGEVLDCPAGQEAKIAAARDCLKKHADDEKMNELRRQRDLKIAEEKAKSKRDPFTCHKELATTEEEKAELRKALERDRLELAAEIAARGPTQASKATDLKFGAHEARPDCGKAGG
ncbi:CPK3 [Symbiodinium sp. CCMP2592]|nr:CPK3 [Symbiodinium sp. CCMP2592]